MGGEEHGEPLASGPYLMQLQARCKLRSVIVSFRISWLNFVCVAFPGGALCA